MSVTLPLELVDLVTEQLHRQKVESRIDANYVAWRVLCALVDAGWMPDNPKRVSDNGVGAKPHMPTMHLLHTLMSYQPATAKELAEHYNTECKYDEFDPLPTRSAQSIGSALARLRAQGHVISLADTDPPEWSITDSGRELAGTFIGTEC